jgi:hypothetical protein
MTTRYVLLLERASQGFNPKIVASCAVVGPPPGYYGLTKTLEGVNELIVALSNARIADYEMNTAVKAVSSGFSSFASITWDQARSLQLLADEVLLDEVNG